MEKKVEISQADEKDFAMEIAFLLLVRQLHADKVLSNESVYNLARGLADIAEKSGIKFRAYGQLCTGLAGTADEEFRKRFVKSFKQRQEAAETEGLVH